MLLLQCMAILCTEVASLRWSVRCLLSSSVPMSALTRTAMHHRKLDSSLVLQTRPRAADCRAGEVKKALSRYLALAWRELIDSLVLGSLRRYGFVFLPRKGYIRQHECATVLKRQLEEFVGYFFVLPGVRASFYDK